MTGGSGHFGFESIVIIALTILVVATLSVFAHVALGPTALI